MGITSISQFGRIYAQNAKTEKAYYAGLDEGRLPTVKGCYLNADDLLRRRVITRLMCDFELDFKAIEAEFKIDFEDYFRWGLENLRDMIDDRLVWIQDRTLRVTEMGRMLIRNVAMNFDGYLERKQDQARYSRTV